MRYFKNKYRKNGTTMSFYRMLEDGTVEYYVIKNNIKSWLPSRKFRGKNLAMVKRFREVPESYIMLLVM